MAGALRARPREQEAAPASGSSSHGRGTPPRARPHRQPASRRSPRPSPIGPCSFQYVEQGGRRASIDPLFFYFFLDRTVFLAQYSTVAQQPGQV